MLKRGRDKRIHVTFDQTTTEILEIMSAKENRPLSEIVRNITESWMERYEDKYWCDLALASQSEKTISHDEAWKGV